MHSAEHTHLKSFKAEGVFTALSLISLLQCLSNNKKMCIDLFSMNGGEGRLYFDNARVVGASINNSQRGEKAFFRMMEWEDARFQAFEVSRIEPEKYRINKDMSSLLMEGLRQQREKERIQQQLHPFYKIMRGRDLFDLSGKEQRTLELVPENGIFVNALVDMMDMTDWEAYSLLQSLIIRKALSLMKIKALVVDGSEFVSVVVRDILELLYEGIITVKAVRSGREAVALIGSDCREQHPDLIFTEIILDEVSGIDVIVAARDSRPPIHVVAVTSLQREMRDILKLGANYLHKIWLTRDNVGEVMMDLVERTLNGEIRVIGGEKEMIYKRVVNVWHRKTIDSNTGIAL
ncbi:MAG: response regulator [Deltaproteobacteria bacterium]|nr:response regulator [Candidatus Zymogenaceae bacterium]